MAIRTGNISGSGISVGNRQSTVDTRGFTAVKVGGVDIKFQPGGYLKARQVVIGDDTTLTLSKGMSLTSQVNGVEIRAQDNKLWVNGEEVHFDGRSSPGTHSDAVDPKKASTPTPSEVRVVQDDAHAAAQVQSKRAGSLFGVTEPVLQRSDVKGLLTGSRVTATDISKLLAAGVSAKDIDSELIKGGDGPMANLLTPEAMTAVLQALPGGQSTFLSQAVAALPAGISIKMAEAALAERTGTSADDQIGALVQQGYTPQQALRQVLSQLDPAPVSQNDLPAAPSTAPPIAPAIANPGADNAQLQQLLQIPAFRTAFLGTVGHPVSAQDMSAMINAVGPQGLKALGSAVVFGSGGVSDRLMPEAMNTFLQAVHAQTNGATAGAVPANVYGQTTQYLGPAATANTQQGFVADPGLQYLGRTFNNNWGSYAASAALTMVAPNLMPFANNFMYGGVRPMAYPSFNPYAGAGLYNPYNPALSMTLAPRSKAEVVGDVIGGALLGVAGAAMSWGGGYGGYFHPPGMWGMGNALWNRFPGNGFGFNMLSGGWPFAMSMW